MRAIGENVVIKVEVSTSSSGLQIRNDGQGVVHSCPLKPELHGKTVLFDDRNTYPKHENFLIIPFKSLLAVIG